MGGGGGGGGGFRYLAHGLYSVAGEGVTKRAASGPFGTYCHHLVTKRAGLTKRAGCASNLTRFVTLVSP